MPVSGDDAHEALLSVVVPSYNSQEYLGRCISSMLPVPDDVEIVIVDDGSGDATPQLADRYAAENPSRIRAAHKPNGGHGSAINAGLEVARGRFFKVLDSDDWFDPGAFGCYLEALRRYPSEDQPDLVITNFVYEKEGKRHKHVMRFRNVFPSGMVMGWDDLGRFRKSQYLLMHALTYRTALLRQVGLELPEHTFYVDNLFAFVPMGAVGRLAYVDVDLYRYYIGRPDQSIQEPVMIKRVDQQLRVNRLMIAHLRNLDTPMSRRQRWYMEHYLNVVTVVSSIMLIRSGTAEHLAERRKLWDELRTVDPATWQRLSTAPMGRMVNLSGKSGRRLTLLSYRLARSFFGFN